MNSEVQNLIAKAAAAEKSEDAMRFSQAANNAANARIAECSVPVTSEYRIKQMVDRFLAWPLPGDFSPDGGISVTGDSIEAVGTNLLTGVQAEAMIRHILAEL